jgi:hypothetical protein
MKKTSPVLKAVLYSFAFIFVAAADLITASGGSLTVATFQTVLEALKIAHFCVKFDFLKVRTF